MVALRDYLRLVGGSESANGRAWIRNRCAATMRAPSSPDAIVEVMQLITVSLNREARQLPGDGPQEANQCTDVTEPCFNHRLLGSLDHEPILTKPLSCGLQRPRRMSRWWSTQRRIDCCQVSATDLLGQETAARLKDPLHLHRVEGLMPVDHQVKFTVGQRQLGVIGDSYDINSSAFQQRLGHGHVRFPRLRCRAAVRRFIFQNVQQVSEKLAAAGAHVRHGQLRS